MLGNSLGDLMRIEQIAAESMLYVGDIDPAGIAIQQGVEDRYGVKPFGALYGAMAERHAARREAGKLLDRYAEKQSEVQYDRARFLALLGETERKEAELCLSESVRIPQEIITAGELGEMAGVARADEGAETDDEELCKMFGTTLEQVEADAKVIESGDLSGWELGESIEDSR